MSRTSPIPLLVILITYLLLGAFYALRTPAWQAPDEPAHYNYIAQLAGGTCCPVIEQGDWDAAYLDQLKASDFAPTLLDQLPTIQYEDHQPPLYYLLLSPIFSITGGSLVALRLATVFIGATVVAYAYILTWLVLPRRPGAALAAAAFVAFLPQFLGITASVNNDALSWSLIGLTLIGIVSYLRSEARDVRTEIMLGVLVGLALLTKVSAIFLLGVVPLAILLKGMRTSPPMPLRNKEGSQTAPLNTPSKMARDRGAVLLRWAAFLFPALLLAGIWWGRNLVVYGAPDFLGLAAHDRVVVGQLRTDELVAELGVGEYLSRALTTTGQSFIGQLGWMALPLPVWANVGIGALLLAALAGWTLNVFSTRRHGEDGATRRKPSGFFVFLRSFVLKDTDSQPAKETRIEFETALVLGSVLVLAVAQYLYYNTEFVQFQGRYMYTGLLPFALLVGGGLDRLAAWRVARGRPVVTHGNPDDRRNEAVRARLDSSAPAVGTDGRQEGRPYADYLAMAVVTLLVPLNLWLLWRVIPGLAP
jgi:hypothetical protein